MKSVWSALIGIIVGLALGVPVVLGFIDYQNIKSRVLNIEQFLQQAIKAGNQQQQSSVMQQVPRPEKGK